MTDPPGHLWHDKWTALTGTLSVWGLERVWYRLLVPEFMVLLFGRVQVVVVWVLGFMISSWLLDRLSA